MNTAPIFPRPKVTVNRVKIHAPYYTDPVYLHRAYIARRYSIRYITTKVLEALELTGIRIDIHIQNLTSEWGTAGRHAAPNRFVVQVRYNSNVNVLVHELRHVWQFYHDLFGVGTHDHLDLPWAERPYEMDAISYASQHASMHERRCEDSCRNVGSKVVMSHVLKGDEAYMVRVLADRTAAGYSNHEREPRDQ